MLNCQQLKDRLGEINNLKPQFEDAYRGYYSILGNKDKTNREVMDKAGELKTCIEGLINEIEQGLIPETKFQVTALNPFHEALKDAGITDEIQNPEIIENMEVDLAEILRQDRKAYEDAGITEWVDDIPENIDDLNLTEEQIELIKSRIEQGEIPIVMPGRQAQLKGLLNAIEKLKPIWIKEGESKPQKLNNAFLWDCIKDLIGFMQEIADSYPLINEKKAEIKARIIESRKLQAGQDPEMLFSAVDSIPDNPYIFTIKPSQSPETTTKNKTLTEQIQEFERIKKANPNYNLISIAEYLALQNRFTSRLNAETKENLPKLAPLDDYYRDGGTLC